MNLSKEEKDKRLHQLKLQFEPEYSKKLKICMWSLDDEYGLTHYGRERAKVCEGGFEGCEGEVEIVTVVEDKYSYQAPRCKNCKLKPPL